MEAVKNETQDVENKYKHTLLHSYLVIAAYIAIFAAPVIIMLLLRRQKGLITHDSTEEQDLDESRSGTGFRCFKVSFTLLLISAFVFVAAQSCLWIYVLTFANQLRYGPLKLDDSQAYSIAQTFFVASMTIRFMAAILTFFYRNTVATLVATNLVMASASVLMAILQDDSYNGVLFLMLLFGIGMGMFQNSLLNWLTDHVVLTPKNSFPFFVASTLGQIVTPSIVPHIILDSDDVFIPTNYMWVVSVLGIVPVVTSTLLMIIESKKFASLCGLKDNASLVKKIEIMPVSVLANVASTLLDFQGENAVSSLSVRTVVTRRSAAAMNGKSKMSVAKIDPVVSFLSTIAC